MVERSGCLAGRVRWPFPNAELSLGGGAVEAGGPHAAPHLLHPRQKREVGGQSWSGRSGGRGGKASTACGTADEAAGRSCGARRSCGRCCSPCPAAPGCSRARAMALCAGQGGETRPETGLVPATGWASGSGRGLRPRRDGGRGEGPGLSGTRRLCKPLCDARASAVPAAAAAPMGTRRCPVWAAELYCTHPAGRCRVAAALGLHATRRCSRCTRVRRLQCRRAHTGRTRRGGSCPGDIAASGEHRVSG